jgi:hypothetical protein
LLVRGGSRVGDEVRHRAYACGYVMDCCFSLPEQSVSDGLSWSRCVFEDKAREARYCVEPESCAILAFLSPYPSWVIREDELILIHS